MRANIFEGRLEATVLLNDGETFVINTAAQHKMRPDTSHVIYPASNVTTNGDGACGVDQHHTHEFDPAQRGNLYKSSPPTPDRSADAGGNPWRHAGQAEKSSRARFRRGAGGDPDKFTCVMALMADHRFYADMAESNEVTTAALIISYIEAANQIYQVRA